MLLIGFGKEIPQSIGSIVVRSIVNKYWLNSVVCGCHHVHEYSHLVFLVDTIVRIHVHVVIILVHYGHVDVVRFTCA